MLVRWSGGAVDEVMCGVVCCGVVLCWWFNLHRKTLTTLNLLAPALQIANLWIAVEKADDLVEVTGGTGTNPYVGWGLAVVGRFAVGWCCHHTDHLRPLPSPTLGTWLCRTVSGPLLTRNTTTGS